MAEIVGLQAIDVRFRTSRRLDGSDAMNPSPDYSGAYVILRTDAADGLEGHALAFTIGRVMEIQVAAIATVAPLVVGLELERVLAGYSSQMRPESLARFAYPNGPAWVARAVG